jgi:hypothetical protein
MRPAGGFARRVRGWAKAHGVPVIDCARGKRMLPDGVSTIAAVVLLREKVLWPLLAATAYPLGPSAHAVRLATRER